MTWRDPPGAVSAHIVGDVSGQVAVGNYILQVGSVHGGVVNIVAPGQRPERRLRAAPVLLRPRAIRGWLDRQGELRSALAAIRSAVTVELTGEPGVGRTAFLRHLAYSAEAGAFPDGVVYLPAARSASDLLQSLFDAFYETSAPSKPTSAELQLALRDRRALLLLDDVTLSRIELETLLDATPACAMVIVTRERTLWGEVQAIPLRGLLPADAVVLLERELGRDVSDDERSAAAALASALEGHPMRLLQAAALAGQDRGSLVEILGRVQHAARSDAVTTELLKSTDDRERRALAALAAVGGAGIGTDALAAMSDVDDAEGAIAGLVRRGLVEARRNRWFLAPGVADALEETASAALPIERAVDGYLAWAEQHRGEPAVRETASAILNLQQRALDSRRWSRVLRLGGLAAGALIVDGQWSAWAAVLDASLEAARAAGDGTAEALALHETGTRALCLGDTFTAHRSLSRAVALRESLGDTAGAAVSRHNLTFLAPPIEPSDESSDAPRADEGGSLEDWPLLRDSPPPALATTKGGVPFLAKAALFLGLAAVGGGAWWWAQRSSVDPAPPPSQVVQEPEPPVAPPELEPPSAEPVVALSPSDIQFGTQVVRTAAESQPLLLTNTGSGTVTLSRAALSGVHAADFTVDDSGCTTALAPSDSCRVSVSFTPAATGERRAVLTFDAGNATTTWTAQLAGAGTSPDRRRITLPAEVSFGSRTLRTSADPRNVVVTNPGRAALKIARVEIGGEQAGDFAIVSDACSGTVLQQRANCTIGLRFTPAGVGARAGRLSVVSDAEDGAQPVALNGDGTVAPAPVARLSPGTIEFRPQIIRQASATQVIRVDNTGNGPLVIGEVSVQGPHATDFPIVKNTCVSTSVAASGNCTVEVGFTPVGTGPRLAMLSLAHNAGDAERTVDLFGTALSPPRPVARVQPETLDFARRVEGTAGESRTVIVTNLGGGTLVVGRVGVSGDHASDFAVDDKCATAKLERGQACTVVVRFAPRGAGTRRAQLDLPDNSGEPGQRVALAGLADARGRLDAESRQVDFGVHPLRSSVPRSLLVRNVGTSGVTVGRVGMTGSHATDFFARRLCDDPTLDGGETCAVEVQFTPTETGSRTATLMVASDDGRALEIRLTGTGRPLDVVPPVTASPPAAATPPVAVAPVPVTPTAPVTPPVNVSPPVTPPVTPPVVPPVIVGPPVDPPRPPPLPGPGVLVVSPGRLEFGQLTLRTRGRPEVVILENRGESAVSLGRLSVEGQRDDFPLIDQRRCEGRTLRPGERCELEVSFEPRGTGSRSATLRVVDATRRSTIGVSLGGTGMPIIREPDPVLRVVLLPERVDFEPGAATSGGRAGTLASGQPPPPAVAARSIAIRNVGDADVMIGNVTLEDGSGDFQLRPARPCGRLRPRDECTLGAVIFRPSGPGVRRGAVAVDHNAPGSPRRVLLAGEGRASPPPPAPTIDRFEWVKNSLCYRVSGASRAQIEPSAGGDVRLPQGCLPVKPPERTTRYTLTVEGPGGRDSATEVVEVKPPPPMPPEIVKFEAVANKLCYEIRRATSASIEPEPGRVSLQGPCVTVNPARTTRYTLTVEGPGGRDQATETVVRQTPGLRTPTPGPVQPAPVKPGTGTPRGTGTPPITRTPTDRQPPPPARRADPVKQPPPPAQRATPPQ